MIDFETTPPIGSQIRWGDPLCKDLIAAYFGVGGALKDGIGNKTAVRESGKGFKTGRYGTAITHTATTDRTQTFAHGNNLTTNAATILVVFAKRDTTNRASGLFGFTSNIEGSKISAHCPYSDGTVYWDYGTSTTGRLSVAGQTWVAGVPSVWVFTRGPRQGMEIWRDGIRIASSSAADTRSGVGLYWYLGAHGTAASDLVDYYAVDVWKRQLSRAEIALVSKNPFAMYGTRPKAALRAFASTSAPTAKRRRQQIVC